MRRHMVAFFGSSLPNAGRRITKQGERERERRRIIAATVLVRFHSCLQYVFVLLCCILHLRRIILFFLTVLENQCRRAVMLVSIELLCTIEVLCTHQSHTKV
jgi:hypothetical protein